MAGEFLRANVVFYGRPTRNQKLRAEFFKKFAKSGKKTQTGQCSPAIRAAGFALNQWMAPSSRFPWSAGTSSRFALVGQWACCARVPLVVEHGGHSGVPADRQTQGGCAAIESGDESPHSMERRRTGRLVPRIITGT
jgi:hypothetical protein